MENDDILKQITDKLGSNKVTSYKATMQDEKMIAQVEVSTTDGFSVDKLNDVIRSFPSHVLSIERSDE